MSLCDPWTVDPQASLPMGFCRQEYWSGLPFPPSGDLLDAGFKPTSPALQVGSLPLRPREALRDRSSPLWQLTQVSVFPVFCFIGYES